VSKMGGNKWKFSLLDGLTLTFCIATAAMWGLNGSFGIGYPKLLVMTGFAVLLLNFYRINRKKRKQIELTEKHIQKMKEEIDKMDFSNDHFFDN
jgi:hypothetical protein